MSKHWFGAHSEKSKGKGHPIMYGKPKIAKHFTEFEDGGGYPYGFLEWAFQEMRCVQPERVLHLCSGSVITGIRVDIRHEMNPTVVADVVQTPFANESFDFILSDPPYSEDYATNLYGTGENYPKPGAILKEAQRLLRPRGLFGFLHFQIPMSRKPMRLVNVYGITTGAGYAIRAWSLFQKEPCLTTHAQDQATPVGKQRDFMNLVVSQDNSQAKTPGL